MRIVVVVVIFVTTVHVEIEVLMGLGWLGWRTWLAVLTNDGSPLATQDQMLGISTRLSSRLKRWLRWLLLLLLLLFLLQGC